MRLLVIVAIVIGILAFATVQVRSYFGEDGARKRMEESQKRASPAKPPSMEVPANFGKHVDGLVADGEVAIGSYQFKNRIVPATPDALRGEQSAKARCETDISSNSWIWLCTPFQALQIKQLAETMDRKQLEMDLEFCLVLMNQDRIRSRGLSVLYDESATWLNALHLDGDTGSLRLATNGFALDLTLDHSDGAASIVSCPVIRVMESSPWNYSIDSEIPIPRSDIVDGTVRNAFEYHKVGFGLSGNVTVAGNQVILALEQRNGNVAERTAVENRPPEFSTQELKTTVRLAWWEWSVLGGIHIDRTSLVTGIFKKEIKSTSDYLVIFVRPRLALSAPPKAVPLANGRSSNRETHPLLPPKGWQDFPDGIPLNTLPVLK